MRHSSILAIARLMEEDKDTELCRYPGKVKAWCSKCYMTFENGPKSQMVLNHLSITDCDSFPCNKPARVHASPCVRRFRSTNSANRHTYCYTSDQVQTWDLSLKVESEASLVDDLMLDSLVLSESPEALLAINSDGGSEGHALRSPLKSEYKHYQPDDCEEQLGIAYELRDDVTVTELIERVKDILGKEYPRKALTKVRNAYKRFGYTSVKVMRIAKQNQGSWEFLYRDFVDVCPEVVAISHVVKYLLCKQTGVVESLCSRLRVIAMSRLKESARTRREESDRSALNAADLPIRYQEGDPVEYQATSNRSYAAKLRAKEASMNVNAAASVKTPERGVKISIPQRDEHSDSASKILAAGYWLLGPSEASYSRAVDIPLSTEKPVSPYRKTQQQEKLLNVLAGRPRTVTSPVKSDVSSPDRRTPLQDVDRVIFLERRLQESNEKCRAVEQQYHDLLAKQTEAERLRSNRESRDAEARLETHVAEETVSADPNLVSDASVESLLRNVLDELRDLKTRMARIEAATARLDKSAYSAKTDL